MAQNKMSGNNGAGNQVSGRPALPILGALGTALIIGLILAVACGGGGGGDKKSKGELPGAGLAQSNEQPTPEATIDLTRPTVVPTSNPNITKLGDADRLVITKFGIDAPLKLKTVASDGQMPDPDGPDDVVLYDFSVFPGLGGGPGTGGNAILAGHVDSGHKNCKNGSVKPPCQAVFWDVNKLKSGDEIEVKVAGQSYKYTVKGNQPVPASSDTWNQIVSSTAEETVTLITCGGTFSNGEYNNRQVITAVRIKA
jgi:LPXTG-site transpeptidase (sortase) family protein